LNLFADLSTEVGDARVKADGLFHATLEIFQMRQIFQGTMPV
jgi:hypothetical protein